MKKQAWIGAAIVCATALSLISWGRRQAVGCYMVSPQSHSRWVRTPVAINEESALIVWDAEHKIEHFIRKATFQTTASHFGFLVPTPSRPELAEVEEALFTTLSSMTWRPPPAARRGSAKWGSSASYLARPVVTVLEIKQVAGFDAAVLQATDPKALNEWLQKHDYESAPELNSWLKPYIDQGWIITAFKIAKARTAESKVSSTAVRMSFQTDRPFFPYREPPRRPEQPAIAEEVIARQPAEAQEIIRLLLARSKEQQRQIDSFGLARPFRGLRVYFLADRAFQGQLANAERWNGYTLFSNRLTSEQQKELLSLLEIKSFQPAGNLWLTEFLDTSRVRAVNQDLYFSPWKSPNQSEETERHETAKTPTRTPVPSAPH
jgi:hypothetical protein